jgi:DNA repair exonuclease SbcCD ATPase subunit
MKTKLSERVRPDCEAAPWVIKEIKELEACLAFERVTVAELKADLSRARSNLTASAEAFQKLERANMDLREVNAQLTGANRELGVAIWSTASQLNDRASRLFQMHTDLVLKKEELKENPCTHSEGFRQLEGDTFCRQCGVNEEETKKQP